MTSTSENNAALIPMCLPSADSSAMPSAQPVVQPTAVPLVVPAPQPAAAPAGQLSSPDWSGQSPFAEIELPPITPANPTNPAANSPESQTVSIALKLSQLIKERSQDPIHQTFYAMRSLATGNPLARNDAGVFYLQAQFMQDFEDDFDEAEPFMMYYPYYQHMGYAQLRTYFTWRSRVRQNNIQPTSLSYVFLHIYELLANIGVADSEQGLARLFELYTAYREFEPKLDNYLPRWLKDYLIYYPLSTSFEEFVNEHQMQRFYPEMFLSLADTDHYLELWNAISSYDITKSGFYQAGNDTLMRESFAAVIDSLVEFCEAKKSHLDYLLIYGISESTPWHPFTNALFCPTLVQPDRHLTLPGHEAYSCRQNHWTASLPIRYSGRRDIAGYLLKKTESYLRKVTNYKYPILADSTAAEAALAKQKVVDITINDIDVIVTNTVSDLIREKNRTVVTVDFGNLVRIRSESLNTQNRLIVAEEESLTVAPLTEVEAKTTLPGMPEDASKATPPTPGPPGTLPAGWATLAETLTPVELEALQLLLGENPLPEVRALADQHNIMLEVLLDSINEKASDTIYDSILEIGETVQIYDEYLANVEELAGMDG